MSLKNANGGSAETRGGTRAETPSVALETKTEEPQKLLPPAPPRLAIEGPRRLPWWRRALPWLLGLAFLALVLLVVHSFSTSKSVPPKGKNAAAGATVNVGKTVSGDINIYIDALGTVTPVNTVTVYSQITGPVIAVHYHEGQMVQKGDPLIDVDPRPYEAMVKQAQGNLDHDRGLLAEARIDLKRYQDAWAKNAIARQQMEDQEQVVVQDEGIVKADEGTVAYDETQLSYCHITAPAGGRVGLRLVDPGNTIFAGSGSTLVVLTQLQPITVVFYVSEDDLPQVNAQLKGGRVLSVDAFDRANEKKMASGSLTSLDNEVDTTTGTIKFRAEFANKDMALFPNEFVNARLLVNTLRQATLAPTVAVQHNGTQAFVYVVQPDSTVTVQNVQVVTSDDQNSAVTGINPGTTIATSGFDRLENGAHVTVKGQPASAAPQMAAPKKGSAAKKGAAPKKGTGK